MRNLKAIVVAAGRNVGIYGLVEQVQTKPGRSMLIRPGEGRLDRRPWILTQLYHFFCIYHNELRKIGGNGRQILESHL